MYRAYQLLSIISYILFTLFYCCTCHLLLQVESAANKNAQFCIAGIPFDSATTNRPGARFGPRAIRDASHMLCDGIHPHFHVSPVDKLIDAGDLRLPNTSLHEMRLKLEPLAQSLLSKHHMIWLGGDHSVTLSLLRAQRAHTGNQLISQMMSRLVV